MNNLKIKWRLPQKDRNFFLQGRNENLCGKSSLPHKIKKKLDKYNYLTLAGMSGTGKTSLAIEYAYRHEHCYDAIYFLQGRDLEQQLESILTDLYSINANQTKINHIVNLIFENEPKDCCQRLFILDDTILNDSVETFLNLIVQFSNTHALITSNSQHWEYKIPVHGFELDESTKFISNYLEKENNEDIKQLAIVLGGLPLALVQAISYIKSTSITISYYLKLFASNPDKVLMSKSLYLWKDNYPYSVFKALSLNLEKLKKDEEKCFIFLEFCSLLVNENIPRVIFTKLFESNLVLNEIVSILSNYSLLTISNDMLFYNVHCLIHKQITATMSDQRRYEIALTLLKLLYDKYFYCRAKPHLFRCFLKNSAHVYRLVEDLKQYCTDPLFDKYYCLLMASQGLYETFERHNPEISQKYLQYVVNREKNNCIELDVEDLGVIYNGLGHSCLLMATEEHYELSKQYFTYAYNLFDDKKHQVTSYALSSLGALHFINHEYEAAKKCLEPAIDYSYQLFKDQHVDYSHFRFRYANLLYAMGDFEKCETLCKEAIEKGEQVSTAGLNFDAAGASELLGRIYAKKSSPEALKSAVKYYKYAVKVFSKLIGNPEHPEISSTYERLKAVEKRLKSVFNKGNVLVEVDGRKVLLSKRENDCLKHVKKGFTAKQIGEILFLSPRTIETHMETLKVKFGCKTKLELVALFSKTA